jgi:signal transduction histidine kinase
VPVEGSSKVLPDGRLLTILRDISERRRVEREREELLSRVVAVVEQCPVALALIDTDLRWQHNARMRQILEMLGIAHFTSIRAVYDEIERRGTCRTGDGRPLIRVRSPSVRALRGERTVGEFLVPDVSGVMRCLSVSAGPIVGPDGAVLGAVTACEDITAQKELERLRAEWGSVVAHDLRQPLGSISLHAQMLQRSSVDPDHLRRAERIRASAVRMNRMVGDLMDLSRLEASRMELVRQRVDLTMLVRVATEHAGLQAPDRQFEVRVQGTIPDADADPDRIAQVLENLLTNAVKYGKAETTVVTSVASDGREVAVSVTNEGPALTSDEIARIFERFQRTDSAKLQGVQGVGLGLYITRSLVEAHGGCITAESTAEGVTTFRFTLPRMSDR